MSVIVRHLVNIFLCAFDEFYTCIACYIFHVIGTHLHCKKPSENREINRVPSSTTSILRVRPMQQQPSNNELQNTHTGNKRHPEMKPNLAKTASSFCLLRVLVCIATRLACARACSCPQYLHIQPHTLTHTQLLPGRPESGSGGIN